MIVNEGKGKDSPDALRKKSSLEKGSIRPQLLLPQPLFPEDAQISQDPGNSTGQQGHRGAFAPDSAVTRWAHTTYQANRDSSHIWAPP